MPRNKCISLEKTLKKGTGPLQYLQNDHLFYHCLLEKKLPTLQRHCLLRTRYNRIFGWGKNNHGQLGMGDTETRDKPTEIVALTQIAMVQVECGGSHTAVLTKNGQIWCFGNNNNGQCGVELSEL